MTTSSSDVFTVTLIAKLSTALTLMNKLALWQTNKAVYDKGKEPSKVRDGGKGKGVGHKPYDPISCAKVFEHGALFPYWDGAKVLLLCPECDYNMPVELDGDLSNIFINHRRGTIP